MNATQIVSLTKIADRSPLAATTATRSAAGWCTRRLSHTTTRARMPVTCSGATIAIIPNSRTIVRQSIASNAARGAIAPTATMRVAPIAAAPVRPIRSGGTPPTATAT